MLTLTNDNYNEIANYTKLNGRKLDYYLIRNLKEDMTSEIIEELKKYQNPDGGFGNSLEPDLRLPDSSAVATEFAINIIDNLSYVDESMINDIVNYLESTFDKEKGYWEIAPKEVDNYPRAIWWNHENIGSFGTLNPTATLTGFLYKHKDKLKVININELISKVENEILNTPVEDIEEHTLLCLIRFASYMPGDIKKKIEPKVLLSTEHTIELDPKKWVDYSPEPTKYIVSKNHELYKKYADVVEENLDYLVKGLNDDGIWDVKHNWYQYNDIFEATAKKEWTGYFAYENLKTLKKFGRLSEA